MDEFLDRCFTYACDKKNPTGAFLVNFGCGGSTAEEMIEALELRCDDKRLEPSTGIAGEWALYSSHQKKIAITKWWKKRGRRMSKGLYSDYCFYLGKNEDNDIEEMIKERYIVGEGCTEDDIVPFSEIKDFIHNECGVKELSDNTIGRALTDLGAEKKYTRYNGKMCAIRTNIKRKDGVEARTPPEENTEPAFVNRILEKYEVTKNDLDYVIFNDIKEHINNNTVLSHQIHSWLERNGGIRFQKRVGNKVVTAYKGLKEKAPVTV